MNWRLLTVNDSDPLSTKRRCFESASTFKDMTWFFVSEYKLLLDQSRVDKSCLLQKVSFWDTAFKFALSSRSLYSST